MLNRVLAGVLDELGGALNRKTHATNYVHLSLGGAPHEVQSFPQPLVRMNTEVSLTKGYENGKVKDGVGCELEELHTIYKK